MPYVNIKITREGEVTAEQKRQLIEGATNLLHDVLGKNKATTVVTIDVGRDRSIAALQRAAQGEDQRLFVVAQRDSLVDHPDADSYSMLRA